MDLTDPAKCVSEATHLPYSLLHSNSHNDNNNNKVPNRTIPIEQTIKHALAW